MCDPVTIIAGASLAITAMSAISSYQQTGNAAQAAQQSAVAANEVNMQTYQQQQTQINTQASEQMSDRAREALVQRGRLSVLAAENGMGMSNSTDNLTRQSYFDQGIDMARIEGHRNDLQQQAYLEAKGGVAAGNSRLNSIPQPSLIGTGLTIAGAAANSAAYYQKNKPTSTSTSTSNIGYVDAQLANGPVAGREFL